MRRESRLSMWMAAVAMATGLIGYCGSEVAEGADAKAGAAASRLAVSTAAKRIEWKAFMTSDRVRRRSRCG